MRYTKANLSTLEEVFAEIGYMVRYEQGNFKSGYCLLKHQNLIVVNKFFTTEDRMNILIDLLGKIAQVEDSTKLKSEEQQEIFRKIMHKK
ncbi:MAG: hypothetical protein EAZ55_03375 [Cytophagales bacterium]|nr:MAG: hypothetical protein EAZ55_03375 [Cytophagales bacterium]